MTFTKTTFDAATRSPSWTPTEANKIGEQLEVLEETKPDNNLLINGGFDVWQRGVSFNVNGNMADRWYINNNTPGQTPGYFTCEKLTATGSEGGFNYIRIGRVAAQTTVGYFIMVYRGLETKDARKYAGQDVTFSFSARKGANFSAASNIMTSRILSGTGTDETLVSTAYPTPDAIDDENHTLTSAWQTFSHTATLSANVTEFSVMFYWVVTGTAGAADYVDIAEAKLEAGDTATTFAPRAYEEELRRCMRYYQNYNPTASTFPMFGTGMAKSSTAVSWWFRFAVPMRATPTFGSTGVAHLLNNTSSNAWPVTSAGLWAPGCSPVCISLDLVANGATLYAGDVVLFYCNGTGATADIWFEAEL